MGGGGGSSVRIGGSSDALSTMEITNVFFVVIDRAVHACSREGGRWLGSRETFTFRRPRSYIIVAREA